ncbi:MAG TPA: type II toxin-antitoxin system RelE/ParE family toxin [Methyloceanibacter sp.]|jgi:plasmid stabilization system protein ParE|nr:type II toxin-antitoxin system RelE/ParE family toxin [Methyloceanibacter sp.]
MKVVLHPLVRSDLDSIFEWLHSEQPGAVEPLLRQIDEAVARIAVWPRLAPIVELENDVRVITLSHYPLSNFLSHWLSDAVEILHVRHTSRAPWEGGR